MALGVLLSASLHTAAAAHELTIQILDGVTGTPLTGLEVTVFEHTAAGLDFHRRVSSNAEGRLRLDLPGLGEGRSYRLRYQPGGEWSQRIDSPLHTAPGFTPWRVGTLQARVLNGQNGAAMAGKEVVLQRRLASGDWETVRTAITLAGGRLTLNPDGLGQGAVYRLRAKSAFDGSWQVSDNLSAPGAMDFRVGSPALVVRLDDGVTGTPLTGLEVTVFEHTAAGLDFHRRVSSNAEGRLRLDLPGLGEGRSYRLRYQPGGEWSQHIDSPLYSAPGFTPWRVGTLQARVLNGQNGAAMTGKEVVLQKRLATGDWETVRTAITLAGGRLTLNPDGLGQGAVYRLRAKSAFDGSWQVSDNLSAPGAMDFRVGSPALVVRLDDGVTGTPLTGLEVTVFEHTAAGLDFHRRVSSNAEGRLRLDLPGLGQGRSYRLRYQPGGEWSQHIDSPLHTAPGFTPWRVGTLQARVLNGQNGAAMTGKEVVLQKRLASGDWETVRTAITLAGGRLTLNPDGLGQGAVYRLRAKSAFDGSWQASPDLAAPAAMDFRVGSPALVVRLLDGVTGTPLAGLEVTVFEHTAGGLDFHRRVTSDAEGRLRLDLPGLGQGRSYRLRYQPGGEWSQRIDSPLYSAPGFTPWRVGTLQARVLNGQNGAAMTGEEVVLQKRLASGDWETVRTAITLAGGRLTLNPDGLGQGAVYRLRAKSAFDGSWQVSDNLSAPGAMDFRVGSPALVVRLDDGVTGTPLTGLEVTVFEHTAAGLDFHRRVSSNAEGRLRLDLPGLGQGRSYRLRYQPGGEWSQHIDSPLHTAPGFTPWRVGTLQARVLNGQNGAAMTGEEVVLQKRLASGDWETVRTAITLAGGRLTLNPDGLGQGAVYRLRAKSAFDGSWQVSDNLSAPGAMDFRVGSPALVVRLDDGVTGTPLTGLEVTVFEHTAAGLDFHRRVSSNAEGRLRLDLPGLGEGRSYRLRYQPGGEWSQHIDSPLYSAPGFTPWRVGTLQARVLNGQNGAAMASKDVVLQKRLATGDWETVRTAITLAGGRLSLNPDGLGQGTVYRLRAKSALDGSWQASPDIAAPRAMDFRVGNPALTVTLADAVTGQGLGGKTVAIWRLGDAGAQTFERRMTTDGAGRFRADLTGLSDGSTRYVLATDSYLMAARSRAIRSDGAFTFPIGIVPVTVLDDATGAPAGGVSVHLLEKHPSGALEGRRMFVTPSTGKLRLDPEDLGSGRVYVLRALDPLGEGRHVWSDLLTHAGAVVLRVRAEDDNKPDTQPPTVAFLAPHQEDRVANVGFTIRGRAVDDRAVDSLELRVIDPVKGSRPVAVEHDPRSGLFTAAVAPASFTADARITLVVTAKDAGLNVSSVQRAVQLADDALAPQVQIVAPGSGEDVSTSGALISGHVSDEGQIATLTATITDPLTGALLETRNIDWSTDGRWAVYFRPVGSPPARFRIVVEATDRSGNRGSAQRAFAFGDGPDLRRRVLDRITFGATPDLDDEVRASGIAAFVSRQLAPPVPPWAPPPTSIQELQDTALRDAVRSPWQLQEVMAWFWDNHFSTFYRSHENVEYEHRERQRLRVNALGRFRDLLGISAKSPAMLTYLNTVDSVKEAPNENYARELLELHTLGVDMSYAQADIEDLARVFTGWTVRDGNFHFDLDRHDRGSKSVLGLALAAGRGVGEGEDVLDLLAAHPDTARFICGKLIALFVSDDPEPVLQQECADQFLAAADDADQIASVLDVIFSSPEFLDPTAARAKFRTPLEMVAFVARGLELDGGVADLDRALRRLGMALFMRGAPDGYPEGGDSWINTLQLFERTRFVDEVAFRAAGGHGSGFDAVALMRARGFETVEGIAAHLLRTAIGERFSTDELALAVGVLEPAGDAPFDIDSDQADARIRDLVRTVYSLPGAHLQ